MLELSSLVCNTNIDSSNNLDFLCFDLYAH
jgi:hypothetical protein